MSGLAVEHLRLRLAELHLALRVAVERQAAAAALLTRPDLTPFCVTDEQVGALLDRVDAVTEAMTEPPEPPRPDPESEQHLRRLAAARGVTLPLDALATRFGLTRAEQDALLLVAAPELDAGYERIYAYIVDNLNRRAPCVELLVTVGAEIPAARLALRRDLGPELDAGYERIYAYIVDNLNRRAPCVELLVTVGAEIPAARLALRRDLGPAGRLRRFGLLRSYREAPAELAQELAL